MKKNALIFLGAMAVGYLLVDTLATYPGFSNVASAANSVA